MTGLNIYTVSITAGIIIAMTTASPPRFDRMTRAVFDTIPALADRPENGIAEGLGPVMEYTRVGNCLLYTSPSPRDS